MSRRDSRVSMNSRQNDALLEFETFKKKFLLANKHITKLNSTLSVRIEELNAQISSLYVENLRLRASEIALASQLKREREKSRKVMAEAEAATLNLTKHLTYLRQSFGITATSPAPTAPTSPRARRRPPNPNPSPNTPQGNRISRPPNVPGIFEEEEPYPSSSEESERQPSPLHRKSKTKPRLSASRLPLPARGVSPQLLQPYGAVPEEDAGSSSKPRKTSRRQSGLLSLNTESLSVPRTASPAFGSPIRRAAGLAEEEEIAAVTTGQLIEVDIEVAEIKIPVKRRKSRGKEREKPEEIEPIFEVPQPRERKRTKERSEEESSTDGGGKPRLKDVTNSRAALSSIGNTVREQDVEGVAGKAYVEPSPPSTVASSSPAPPLDGEGAYGGRERRTRKSVNYAEPKLNTKMRKPETPSGGVPPPRKRSSAAAVLTTYRPLIEDNGNDGDNDTEARSSLEQPPLQLRVNGNVINPASFPLPPSRPPSSASLFSPPPAIVHTSSSTTAASSSSSSSGASSVKRKKSRPQVVVEDEDESEGAQADSEYGVGKSWVNTDGRRKMGPGNTKRNVPMSEDGRRHSMAV